MTEREDWHLRQHESEMIVWIVGWCSVATILLGCWFIAWYLATPTDQRVRFLDECSDYSDHARPTAEMLQAQKLKCAEIASKMEWR